MEESDAPPLYHLKCMKCMDIFLQQHADAPERLATSQVWGDLIKKPNRKWDKILEEPSQAGSDALRKVAAWRKNVNDNAHMQAL
jgi:hypothetical protein